MCNNTKGFSDRVEVTQEPVNRNSKVPVYVKRTNSILYPCRFPLIDTVEGIKNRRCLNVKRGETPQEYHWVDDRFYVDRTDEGSQFEITT